ncbi:MAG: hypothetical protein HY474_01610 [Candidatus Sungbacteria bacterium]|uniref:Uncharacterized protein n=1 Tax=Candidatus Sungiibacteriota bacterium TaxID=2750080 RepID=A0A932YVP3_9BACT|nr:hypothetical protein [Candidatus Sungbacteria bacterium]
MKTHLISLKPAHAAGAILLAAAMLFAAGTAGAASAFVSLKKDSNGLFTLTINDGDGIKSFSLVPSGKGPYGGEIAKCPRVFQNTNVLFADPADFTPVMAASITDCSGNTDELEIPPPEDGATRSKRLKPPAPPPAPEEKASESEAAAETPTSRPAKSEAEAEAVKAELKYPIAELGNCGSEVSCRAYCEELANIKTCIAYAESHRLITAEEAAEGRRFAEAGGRGPGGCTSRESCAAYCEDITRIDECLEFAEKNGFLSGKELEEAQAVAKVRREGVQFPGGCTTKAQCETYCQQSGNMEECLAFAERSGLIPPEELAQAKKMLPLIKEGKTPGGCTRKESCEAYCQQPGNMRECLAFAESNGLIPPEELEQAKKFLPLMERGETPGGCRSKEQCEAYCGGEGHLEECLDFGERSGFISKEDAELARKTGGAGPGGCRSKEQCEAYCGDPEHVEDCVSFAERTGLISSEDAEMARQAGGSGPGGCRSRDECEEFCKDPANSEECVQFSVKSGQINPEEAGFAKTLNCRSREECMALCQQPENAEKCAALAGPPGGPDHGGPPPGFDGEGKPGSIREEIQRQFEEEALRRRQLPEGKEGQIPEEFRRQFEGQVPFPGGGATEGQFPGGGATDSQFPGGADADRIRQEFQQQNRQQIDAEIQKQIEAETQRRMQEETERLRNLTPEGSYPLPPETAYPSAIPPSADEEIKRCTESGGSWNGTACILPSAPTSSRPGGIQENAANALQSFTRFLKGRR